MTGSRRVNRRRDYLTPADTPDEGRDLIVRLETSERFRRTYVRRAKGSVAQIGVRLAADAAAVNAPHLRIEPRYSQANCPRCVFREPCGAMDAGIDPRTILAARFRKRSDRESLEEESLRYSPVREAAAERGDQSSRTARLVWG